MRTSFLALMVAASFFPASLAGKRYSGQQEWLLTKKFNINISFNYCSKI